jgi:O-acetylhomoserine (thiol)-lyase
MCEEDQLNAGICQRLLRLSVGIEHVDDLLADLQRGFEAVRRFRGQPRVCSVG